MIQCFIGLQTYIYTGINIVYRQWPDRHSPRSNVLNSLFIYDHMNLIQPYYFVENYLFQKGFPRRGRLSQDGLANLFKCVCVQWSHFFKKLFITSFCWFIEIRTDRYLIFFRKIMWSLDHTKLAWGGGNKTPVHLGIQKPF